MEEFFMNVVTEGILEEMKKNHNKNVVMSPASLNLVLNMAASGSAGKTLKQFLRFLGAKDIADLNSKSSSLMAILDRPRTETTTTYYSKKRRIRTETTTDKNAPVLSMVNVMFVDQRCSLKLKPSFQEIVQNIYKTQPTIVDFTQAEKLINEVNSWAEKNTKGLIKEILPPSLKLKPPLILANALYFKATWKVPFKASSTQYEDFHLLNGTAIKVPFMTRIKKKQSYGTFEDFKVLRLYYNPGDYNYYTHEHHMTKYCMDIILPHRKDGLQDVLNKFNSDTKQLVLLKGGFELKRVRLTKLWIPKWKFAYGFDDPIKLMEKLGLTLPFHFPAADFTNMMDSRRGNELFIMKMLQKSFVEVNEEGTEAASVSLAYMRCGCGRFPPPPPPEVKFVADHPFMFIIREQYSGAVIFTGAVLNPLSNI